MPGLNFNQPGAYFSPTTGYAGSLPMMWALGQYFNELAGPQSTGQAQLAASRASADPAMEFQGAYGATPSAATGGPGQAGSQDAFARLAGGMSGARSTGRQVQSQVRNNALQGVGNVGSAYGNDISSNISAQMALEQAKAQQNALMQDQITGLVTHGISAFADPNFMSTGSTSAVPFLPGGSPGVQSAGSGAGPVKPSPWDAPYPSSGMTESNIGPSGGPPQSPYGMYFDPNQYWNAYPGVSLGY